MSHGRTEWVDVAKGLGIIAVVLGHNPYLKNSEWKTLHDALFLFHMPLFFFLSGWVHRVSSVGVFFSKKWRTILVPYVFASLIFAAIAAKGDVTDFVRWAAAAAYGIGDLMAQPHLWFLPVLFATG